MTSTHPVRRGQRYKRAILGLFAAGIVGFFTGMVVDQYLAGLVIYTVACLAGIAGTLYLQFGTSIQLYDEREQRVAQRASQAVVNVVAYVMLPVFIGIFLLDATGRYTMGSTVEGVLYAFSAFYLLWGVAFVIYNHRT